MESISLSITAEYMGNNSQNNLIRVLPELISWKIERSVYNRRRRRLTHYINNIRLEIAENFNEFEDFVIVECMPLDVCKLSRSSRYKLFKHR